ncbi:alkanesulfonate monooxygenase [Hyaloscypha finlandica]|nr:alkanesulfonate monooxygenase [Hyaloscypha finlandica]
MVHSKRSKPSQLHLTAFMRPVSLHTGAWRYPGAYPDANFNFGHIKSFIQKLEAAKFDAFFMADHLAVLNMPVDALKRSHTVTSFEPVTLLSALPVVTEKIGLAATASTLYDEPYHIARRFASLNFGLEDHVEHSYRYKRAREFYDVVTGLWDSFADDAFIRDQESGIYFDPEKMHVLNHKGDDMKVKGPLNVARPVQGWPVIVQAGQSDPGRQLAAETAEATIAAGRDRTHLKILPAAFIVIGNSLEDAQAKRLKLDSLVHYDSATRIGRGTLLLYPFASLSIALGSDASGFDPDSPLPTDLPETNASKTSQASVIKLVEKEKLTVRQLAQRLGGYSGLAFVGTPESIADEMGTWLAEEAADGFTVVLPFLPQGLDEVINRLVPELQPRGLFRKEYEGNTLRKHLGLPRPKNRFFERDNDFE